MCEFHNNWICKSILNIVAIFSICRILAKALACFKFFSPLTLVVYSLDIHEATKTGN